MNVEPLKPSPEWHHTPGAGWHDTTAVVSGRVGDPSSYVKGFEDGAYALAALLYPLAWSMDTEKREQALIILRQYHDGLAHPVKDWQHEPKRN